MLADNAKFHTFCGGNTCHENSFSTGFAAEKGPKAEIDVTPAMVEDGYLVLAAAGLLFARCGAVRIAWLGAASTVP